jgi:NTE family protein
VAGRKDIPLHQLVPLDLPLEFCFNATDIIFGVRWVAERCRRKGGGYHHRVGSYRAGYGFYEGKRPLAAEKQWSLARAVAASSCFPPVFGPMKIRWSASDYRKPSYLGVGKTRELRESDRRRKLEAMMVNDGGNYGNLGLLAASRAKVVIVSDGGAPLDYSPPEGPFQLLGRYSGLLMSVNVNQSLQELLKAFESSKKKGAIARIGRRLDDRQNTPEAIERHWNAQWIAGIRTDLAPLTALEYQATKELGYVSIDERIERYGRDVLPISKAAPATDVEVLDDPELDRKMAFRKCRMLAPWLRRWLTRPIRRH